MKKKTQAHQFVTVKDRDFIVIDKFMYSSEDLLGEGAFGKVYRGFSV